MLGDAIHNVHPITGQGMNLAIEDASALADALDLALRDACALEDALAGYQAERFPVNQAIVSYGHALATSLEDRQRFAGVRHRPAGQQPGAGSAGRRAFLSAGAVAVPGGSARLSPQASSRKRSGSTRPAAMAMPTSSGRVWACMRFITRAR